MTMICQDLTRTQIDRCYDRLALACGDIYSSSSTTRSSGFTSLANQTNLAIPTSSLDPTTADSSDFMSCPGWELKQKARDAYAVVKILEAQLISAQEKLHVARAAGDPLEVEVADAGVNTLEELLQEKRRNVACIAHAALAAK